jgi:hypothetical protein
LQIDRIDRADLPLFEDYLKSKHALYSKLYRQKCQTALKSFQ